MQISHSKKSLRKLDNSKSDKVYKLLAKHSKNKYAVKITDIMAAEVIPELRKKGKYVIKKKTQKNINKLIDKFEKDIKRKTKK